MSSTYDVPVVEVKLRPHPNADTLSIVDVFGWQVVVKTEDWKDGDLAAYIRPDSVVPDLPEWAWLDGKRRIRTRRFRGEWSHGLISRALPGARIGDDLSTVLDITPYEPPSARREGPRQRPKTWWARLVAFIRELGNRPRGRFPYYDIEHLRRNLALIPDGTPVMITEKIHGANACYVWRKPWLGRGKVYMRSRTMWKWPGAGGWWEAALAATPEITTFLKTYPQHALYGEVYGPGVQDLTYGEGGPKFVAFDVWDGSAWWSGVELSVVLAEFRVPQVPLLYQGGFNLEQAVAMANGNSVLAKGKAQVSEGVVVKTLGEHRKQLKIVSDRYMEKTA